jgi:ABC-type lipoprotein export system ATPase subunit
VVLDLLESMNDGGLTLLVVTHDAKVAQRADRIVVLLDGRIVQRAASDHIGDVLELLASVDDDDGDAAAEEA